MRIVFLCLLWLLLGFGLKAQLRIDTAKSPSYLVRNVLLGKNSQLLIENIRYTGHQTSIASFQSPAKTNLLDQGIVLSTGNVYDMRGPNGAMNTGTRTSGISDYDLQSIATGPVFDAAILEFDLLALKDSVVFYYVFASEEYPEFVSKGVNDVFGFFIREHGDGSLFPLNIARIPGTRKSVSIDNLNHRVNEEFFLKSDFIEAKPLTYWEQNQDELLRAQYFEFDGFTKLMKASLKLAPGKKYHLKIAIGDVGDRFYDSAVLLQAKSLSSAGTRLENADDIVYQFLEKSLQTKPEHIQLKNGELNFSLKVQFESGLSKPKREAYKDLNALLRFMQSFQDVKVEIIGHTDDIGSTQDNMQLSKERAISIKDFLALGGIEEDRVSWDAKGETQSIANNNSEEGRQENRRVEFRFIY